MKRCAILILLAVLVGTSLGVLADRRDPLGSTGTPLPMFMLLQEYYTRDLIDSGCQLIYCQGDCDQWDTGWKCWTKAKYSRYGIDENQQIVELPISISAIGDCKVSHLWVSTVYCSKFKNGSGVVKADTSCWINVIFAGVGWNFGGCACTEL